MRRLTGAAALATKPVLRRAILALLLLLLPTPAMPQVLLPAQPAAVPRISIAPPPEVKAQSAAPASRGELLYRNHCIACHSTSVHWRDRRLVTDFGSLIAQVGRWERNAGLGWSSEEILDVVQYLNATIYRFPDKAPQQKG